MKNLITVIVCAMIIASCGKQAGKQSATTEKMNGVEFKTKYKIELPFLDYGNGAMLRGKPKPKAELVALSVIDGDLVLSGSGGSYHSTTSENAEWAAFQNLTDTVSLCNFNWSNVAAPTGIDCGGVPTGIILRTFTSDKSTSATAYDIHLSNIIQVS